MLSAYAALHLTLKVLEKGNKMLLGSRLPGLEVVWKSKNPIFAEGV